MRKNLPVTDVEYQLPDDTLIVSTTDTKGKLTFFNEQFVAASGFTEQELMGQPHNIVRHPDMPPAAFENLWETLKGGRPWVGAVKNRRKNGDYYWVLASATPVWENGVVTGYMSVRTKLPADQRAEAEQVYAALRENKGGGYRIDDGIIRRRSWRDRLSIFNATLKARLTTLVTVQAVIMLVTGAAGIYASRSINLKLQSVYEDRTIAMQQLSAINDGVLDDAMALRGAFIRAKVGKPIPDLTARTAKNTTEMTRLFDAYKASYLTPEEKQVADAFAAARKAYVEEVVHAGTALSQAGKTDELGDLLTGRGRELLDALKGELDKLVAIQVKEAKVEYESGQREYLTVLIGSIGLLALGLLLGVINGVLAIRAIGRPLGQLNEVMDYIAQGRFDSRIRIERDDEIGLALRNLQAMQNKLFFSREEEKDNARRAAHQRKIDMQRIAGDFEVAIGEIVQTVSSASSQLEASAGTLTSTASRSQELTVAVAAASEEASANVQSVASATEEMSSSVTEISRQVQESARIAHEAVAQAQRTNDRVGELSQAASRIGAVVELINTIAGQTNLLALNATIEAARAGEAGRGFAVVASEVKALAEQTAKATGEISQQISGIQTVTDESVGAIREIGVTIDRMSEISSTIASAVEEQGAATQEIARNVQQAAEGTLQVSANIADVQSGTTETGTASSQVLLAAQALSRDSARLKAQVTEFLATVRAA